MEIPTPTIQTDDKDTYAFHLSLFGALCRTLTINGMGPDDVADTFGIPVSILSRFAQDDPPLPTPEAIVGSADIKMVRCYPPFSFMDAEAFDDYRTKIALLKESLAEEI